MWIVCFLALGLQAMAVTPEQVLATAWLDKSYVSQETLRSVDSGNPLRNVEGFTSVEKEDNKEQRELGLKLQFRSWAEWKLARGSGFPSRILKEAALAWALHERYVILASLAMADQKREVLQRSMMLAERFLKVQALSLKAGRSSSKSVLAAQKDLYGLKRLEAELNEERALAEEKIRQWVAAAEGVRLEGFDLISVVEISRALEDSGSLSTSLSRRLSEVEYEDISRELEILRARENQWVKGLDLSQSRKGDEIGYKVELSIQLPGLGADDLSRQKQNELILKRALKQKELDASKGQFLSLRRKLQNLLGLYVSSQKNRFKEGRGGADTLLEIEEKLLRDQYEMELLIQQQEILTLYLQYLFESGKLVSEPTKNHLSQSGKVVRL